MIKIDKTDVCGFDVAIRAMRNSFDSWDKSDSAYYDRYVIGEYDLALMQKLIRNGDDHAKFMRFVTVTCDITAPRYWWTEFDTYKVGTVRCSCSTMHTITKRDLTIDDFSYTDVRSKSILHRIIGQLNEWVKCHKTSGTKEEKKMFWRCIIETLPQSFNQKSTVLLNYQVLRHMYHARKHHKLSEWHDFCDWVEELPYADELIICE